MNAGKSFAVQILACVFLFATLFGLAHAQKVYDPQGGGPPPGAHLHFTNTKWQIASSSPQGNPITGECVLDCYDDEQDEVTITLKGLQKDGIYTVWVVRKDGDGWARARVAVQWEGKHENDNFFEVTNPNRLVYHGWLHACPLGKYQKLEIRYHPDKNAQNVDASVPVVKISLKGS